LVVLLRQIVGQRGWVLPGLIWLSVLVFAFEAIAWPAVMLLSLVGVAGAMADRFQPDAFLSTLIGIAICALFVALFTAREASRQRVRWLFWGFAPFYVATFLHDVSLLPQYSYALRLVELSLPIALFYGVLVRRVVDIGFVFNRVAIYGVLSLVLVVFFIVLEYGASKVFLESSRAGSLVVQLGVALTVGLSGRYVHRIVDRFVDRVFFAKRHADESALRRFAREAEAYTSPEALLDQAVEILRKHSETRGTGIYLTEDNRARAVRASDGAFPSSIDLDDPLLVKLRRWNEPIDTHDVRTAFPDGIVVPLGARQKLLGAMACRTKRDDSAFDPDERESLVQVARGLGSALDALASESGDDAVSIRKSILALAEAVAQLGDKIDALPATTDLGHSAYRVRR
ncbi:MAG: GAF domain-containing protein, partial [Candidatus Eremiobacteraeota bacterium]|nr:GAF domain-containing protein [Candidatus Eremiobacteraeota bacterium]